MQRRTILTALFVVLSAVAVVAPAGVASAAPPAGPGWVVSLGDSYISGEAGRWAGASNKNSSWVDTGSNAYYDNAAGSAETITNCHRSRAAEIHIGNGVKSLNLACSGATTATQAPSGGDFKPGIDFYNSGGKKGQALMLAEFAATNHVDMIVVSIGGNDYNFKDVVVGCVTNWATSPAWWPNYCHDDSGILKNFSASNVAAKTAAIAGAYNNIRAAMTMAGYTDADYTIVVQNYPSPIPPSASFRYPQSGWTRMSVGGCGFWDKDADWANNTALGTINNSVRQAVTVSGAPNIRIMDISQTFVGRRLCEKGVGVLEEVGLTSWTQPGAADKTEWVNQIRTATAVFPPYQMQEGIHPNYWGQLAVRNCVRQAYNGGAVRGGACRIAGPGLNAQGEPNTVLG